MTILDSLMPILQIALELLKPILDLVLGLVAPLLQIVSTILEPITNLIDKLVKGPLAGLTPVLEELSGILSDVIGNSIEYVMKKIEIVTNVFSDLIDFISNVFAGDWEGAWESIVAVFGDIFSGIVELVKFPLNKIIELINGAIDGFNAIQIPDWVPGVGGMGLSIPKIPKLAKGGIIDEPGVVMVGEEGPELLSLPTGASVSPLNNGIDYDKLTSSFIAALREVAPMMAANIRVEGNRDRIVDIVVEENQNNILMTGEGLFA
jgi:phage-related protein